MVFMDQARAKLSGIGSGEFLFKSGDRVKLDFTLHLLLTGSMSVWYKHDKNRSSNNNNNNNNNKKKSGSSSLHQWGGQQGIDEEDDDYGFVLHDIKPNEFINSIEWKYREIQRTVEEEEEEECCCLYSDYQVSVLVNEDSTFLKLDPETMRELKESIHT